MSLDFQWNLSKSKFDQCTFLSQALNGLSTLRKSSQPILLFSTKDHALNSVVRDMSTSNAQARFFSYFNFI